MNSNKYIHRSARPRKSSTKSSKLFSRPRKRLRELERAIRERHGCVPATDDADLYLRPVANCFRLIVAELGKSCLADIISPFGLWCERFAPEATDQEIAALAKEALARPAKLVPDDALGKTLRFSYDERRRQKATTIGSYDVDRAARKKLAKARKQEGDRIGAEKRRRANGAIGSVTANDEIKFEETGRRVACGAHLPPFSVALDIQQGKLRGWLLVYKGDFREPISADVLERQGSTEKFIVNLRNGTTWWRHVSAASRSHLFHLGSRYCDPINDVEVTWVSEIIGFETPLLDLPARALEQGDHPR